VVDCGVEIGRQLYEDKEKFLEKGEEYFGIDP
jgi:hypothetical protein